MLIGSDKDECHLSFVTLLWIQAIWYYAMVRFHTSDLKSHPIAQFKENCIIRKKC